MHKNVHKIQGLEFFSAVKSINLASNKIGKIENLDHMKLLQVIDI